jgi:hypothetical protein
MKRFGACGRHVHLRFGDGAIGVYRMTGDEDSI